MRLLIQTNNMKFYLNFFTLRLDSWSQFEIRLFRFTFIDIVRISVEVLIEFVLNSSTKAITSHIQLLFKYCKLLANKSKYLFKTFLLSCWWFFVESYFKFLLLNTAFVCFVLISHFSFILYEMTNVLNNWILA